MNLVELKGFFRKAAFITYGYFTKKAPISKEIDAS